MKLRKYICPYCGADIKVDTEGRRAKCEYCDSVFMIEDESESSGMDPDSAEEAGYRFEKGRQRARDEQKRDRTFENAGSTTGYSSRNTLQSGASTYRAKPEKRRTWLWVLGWIFMFPAPLTILLVRNKQMNTTLRTCLIIFSWILYLSIASAENAGSSSYSQTESRTSTASSPKEQDIAAASDHSDSQEEAGGRETKQEASDLYPVPDGFVDGFEKPDFDAYNSPASENGLANTKIWIEGTIEKVDKVESKTNENTDSADTVYYYVIKQSDGNKWMSFAGIGSLCSAEEIEARNGHSIVITGVYQGFSDVLQMPVLAADLIFDRTTGERYSAWMVNLDDGTFEFANCTFDIPGNWAFRKWSPKERYFYPDQGMLMVQFEKFEGLTNVLWSAEETQKSYLDGVQKGFDEVYSFEYESINIDGAEGVLYSLSGAVKGKGSVEIIAATFPTKNGLTSFAMYEELDEKQYSEDFRKILDSIKIMNRVDEN